jgi:hypothetical protein
VEAVVVAADQLAEARNVKGEIPTKVRDRLANVRGITNVKPRCNTQAGNHNIT